MALPEWPRNSEPCCQGNSNKRIAQQLDVSVRTVETHRLNLRKKLGVETPAGLIRYALQQGWIKV